MTARPNMDRSAGRPTTAEDRLIDDMMESEDLDAFFNDVEVKLMSHASQSVPVQRSWLPFVGGALGLLLLVSAVIYLLTNDPTSAAVTTYSSPATQLEVVTKSDEQPTATPRTEQGAHTTDRMITRQTPAQSAAAPTTQQQSEPLRANASASSNASDMIRRADSLQLVLSTTTDPGEKATLNYTIGVLHKRTGQPELARRSLAQAEALAMSVSHTALLAKIKREQASLR
ncbi:MAG TPA: hypothetical protein VK147_00135 [Candidatus Didemnitutus sp.]|nr:hypothetical protein [Candidatus Didemnitutus sp.]